MDVRIDYKDIDKIENAMYGIKNIFGGKYLKVFQYAKHECCDVYRKNINKAIKAYMRDANWIDVEDSLPPEGAHVLVCCEDGNIWVDDYFSYGFDDCNDSVVAWMPLPQPYKRDKWGSRQ